MSQSALDLLKAKAATTATQDTSSQDTSAKEGEKMFQEYRSSRLAMRVVTNKGIQCIFNGNRFFTDDPEVIEYLDYEIKKAPMLGVTKGEMVASSARDPNKAFMDEVKAKMREELRAELLAELDGNKRDFGSYAQAAPGAGMTTTANMIGSSDAQ